MKKVLTSGQVIDDFLRIGKRTQTRALVDGGGATRRHAVACHLQQRRALRQFSVIAPTMLSPAPTVLWLFIGGGTT
jgi:hypothetical protein